MLALSTYRLDPRLVGLGLTLRGLAEAIKAPPSIVAAPAPEAVVRSCRRENPDMAQSPIAVISLGPLGGWPSEA